MRDIENTLREVTDAGYYLGENPEFIEKLNQTAEEIKSCSEVKSENFDQ